MNVDKNVKQQFVVLGELSAARLTWVVLKPAPTYILSASAVGFTQM